MTDPSRPSTPPRASSHPPQRTPEAARHLEEQRLKAKSLYDRRRLAAASAGSDPSTTTTTTPSGFLVSPLKRPAAAISTSAYASSVPSTSRDARADTAGEPRIEAARKFRKFVDHDFSAVVDTKGGFLAEEDGGVGSAGRGNVGGDAGDGGRPAHMTLAEWERLQLKKSLQRRKEGPFEPGLSVLEGAKRKKCSECGSWEIDWVWEEVFGTEVCARCKEKFPEKYSLLTKTEVKDDYLLTDPELKDPELLPHLSKPNPHKSHWHDMMLFLRYQVEEYALGPSKWGSAEALDAEFARREADKKKRKEEKFRSKLVELKRKTRAEHYRRAAREGGAGGTFGDKVGGGKHEHEWGATVEDAGRTVRACVECGMEVEEVEL
ncbi:hypothetical protein VC83_00720 [Pseudogymnoascus destructans]|uniref:DNA repair protein RAD14 n=2 Tax=Pseudogymnoascus destructans TaxID=655981 RepID=L8GDI3_PSED2|nr:uncharacterized protein VC83_00720 [Pseudogymnoascus destructans]ELR10156.1 hypothetical protein GMDG_04550 [Pseudogymnoascus destructans 20631-21]OAF62738.1 hypothetical protein VC83_00720 [Pseudogymnoascus destructans]